MVRLIALLLGLALAHPALAQTAPGQLPQAQPSARPAQKKPAPPKAGAAAEPAGAAAQPAAPRGRCIGVIPYIGDSFSVRRVGVTVFGNEAKNVPIHTWGLDDVVVARVRAAAGPRFVVRRIAYAKDAFHPLARSEPRLFLKGMADLKAVVEKIAKGGGCERYVLVMKGYRQFSNSNQLVGGIGIVNYGFSAISRTYLFAISAIIVYDGRTFAVLKAGVGAKDEENILASALLINPMRGPNRELKDFAWPPSPAAVMGLRESARSLLTDSLDKALPRLLAQ